jgi:hypothetical protein
MTPTELARRIDHTISKPDATGDGRGRAARNFPGILIFSA